MKQTFVNVGTFATLAVLAAGLILAEGTGVFAAAQTPSNPITMSR